MFESIQERKRQKDRNKVAGAVKAARRFERENHYNKLGVRDRDSNEYLFELRGLESFFKHVKRLGTPRVLDIGAGTTLASSELAKTGLAEGVDFEATVLTGHKDIKNNLGAERTHITPVESLRGIANASFGGAIGVYSVSYSQAPDLAVKNIERILVPGGIFKGKFFAKDLLGRETSTTGIEGTGIRNFIRAFIKNGFSVAEKDGVLVAVKPFKESGGTPSTIAEDILKEDEETFDPNTEE